MPDQNFDSVNIDDYANFNFTTLGNNEIEVSEQNYRSFPLSIITQKDQFLDVHVHFEVYMSDHWIRNYSIKKFETSYWGAFKDLQIEGIQAVKAESFDEEENYILLSWQLKMPLTRWQSEIKTAILKSVDLVLFRTRLALEEDKLPTGIKKYILVNGNSICIGWGTFWGAMAIICGCSFFLGGVKYDTDKMHLSEQKKALEDTVRVRDNTISKVKHNSDSALDILGHMPYNQMSLDTLSFRKVQTTIVNAGAVLTLNK